MILFDLKKSYLQNIKKIEEKAPGRRIYIYTNKETYIKSEHREKIVTKKLKIWKSEDDIKILEYYNSKD